MQFSQPVLATYARIQAELGSSFSFDALCSYVEQWRGKPLVFRETRMPLKLCGLCAPLADVDLVLTRIDLDSILRVATQLHELAHLLLNHLKLAALDNETATYAEYLTGNVVLDGLAREFQHTAPFEYDAETLAMFLHRCIAAHDQDAPSYAQQLYGRR